MSRRIITLAVASVLVLALAAVGALLPVPYVALQPGPTTDTLGTLKKKGKPIIAVEGRRTYPTKGDLRFVTIAYAGGPQDQIRLFTALRGWLDPRIAVLPQRAIFPEGQSVEEFVQRTSRAMTASQRDATVAALQELDIPVSTEVAVHKTQNGHPADGVLHKGDVITAVDGTKVSGSREVIRLVSDREPGHEVSITVRRDGETKELELTTTAGKEHPDRAIIGALLEERISYPFTVRYHIGDVGGPSAGMMFSLGLVDKLTPGSLTGGKVIAGTGTIDPDGSVGEIGGVTQKMVGARAAGATVFLTPSGDCASAAATVPDGLRLVRVDTLHGAIEALDALRTGKGSVPTC